ncbi:Uncharacterized protein FWK35_00000535 [Aphis craccivora]|uniref:Gustatory receptor n=1 Tax=Aphis craccivora TaxID=307492 RepID=A0A6G0ZRC8_APHCR|nr:Uncharacterized protein FWK35_00000535 [Aphis craccivora]
MNIVYLTKILNCIFILSGNGSAKFVKRTWLMLCYAWRFILISIFLINVHNGIKWTLNNVRDIMEPISIVLIMSVHLKLLGPVFSIAWRLYFDNEFSNMLKKCMDTLDVLKKCNSEVVLRAKMFWTFMINRTNLILNKRSLTENLTNRRKIAFFSLRRLHGNFQFELCGFHKINLRQFLSLLFKTILFLIVQIQLNIKSLTQSFS